MNSRIFFQYLNQYFSVLTIVVNRVLCTWISNDSSWCVCGGGVGVWCVSVYVVCVYLSVHVDECVDICVDVDMWCVCGMDIL